jgi:hypothetical protein
VRGRLRGVRWSLIWMRRGSESLFRFSLLYLCCLLGFLN